MANDNNNIQLTSTDSSQIVIYQPDETISLEVKLEQETVWLTQAQMAELFQKDQSNIARHINNIFREGELQEDSNMQILHNTLSKYKPTKIYSLDVIISVGYRVKSQRGTQFRIWATSVLRDHLLRGFSINHQLVALQERIDNRLLKIEDTQALQQNQINFFIRTNQPPHEGCVFQGHLLEGRNVVEQIIRSATREVILIDAYVGADTFHILESRNPGVTATIYTEKVGQNIQTLQHDHETEYGETRHIEVLKYRTNFHDRFLIIDDTVYHFGASLKDLGRHLFAFDIINLPKSLILSQVI